MSRTLLTRGTGSSSRAVVERAVAFTRAAEGGRAVVLVTDAELLPGGVREAGVAIVGLDDVAGTDAAWLKLAFDDRARPWAAMPFALAHIERPVLVAPAGAVLEAIPEAALVVIDEHGAGVAFADDAAADAAIASWTERVLAADADDPVGALAAAFPRATRFDVAVEEGARSDDPHWFAGAYEVLLDGTPLSPRLRELYLEACTTGELSGTPYEGDGFRAFAAWLSDGEDGVGRYLRRVWRDRDDLQDAFPSLEDAATKAAFLEWVAVHGRGEEAIPPWLGPGAVGVEDRIAVNERRRTRERQEATLGVRALLASVRLAALEHDLRALRDDAAPVIAGARVRPWMADDAIQPSEHPLLGRVVGFRDATAPAGDDHYRQFEDVFRGPPERVKDLLAVYVDLLRDHGPVLDVGAGRGELLELLGAAGVPARGVDLDPGMVAAAVARGLDVVHGDALALLRDVEPATLGAVTAIHVIEHLPYHELVELFRSARRALQPGGLLVCETINPHTPYALKTFWVDPTHQHPLFPEVVLVHARSAGFPEAFVTYPRGRRDATVDWADQDAYALVAVAG